MANEEKKEPLEKRILVLCVDRDGDLGLKAEVKTPVVGRKDNLNAAMALALKDPEEPDANAMFEAVRMYDHLASEAKSHEIFEVATISGSQRGGVVADRKIAAELEELKTHFGANEVVLVVDGYSDEAVLPVVQSRVPVASVRRIVVKHSEAIEETAALFSRYAQMIFDNPRYSRLVIGVPGVLFLILGVLYLFQLLNYFLIIAVFVVSAVMVGKGFGADRAIKGFYKWVKEYSAPPLRVQVSTYSAIAGILCIVLGTYLGWNNAASFVSLSASPPVDLGGWLTIFPSITGYFIEAAMTLIVVGVGVALLGRAIRNYFERDPRVLRNAALIFSVAWSRQILDATSGLLLAPTLGYEKLIFTVAVGILIGLASVLVVLVIHRSTRGFFHETVEQVEEFEER